MKTLVTFLLDRTGSMAQIADDTIGGFNTYLNSLKDEPDIEFTLIQFDSLSIDKLHVKQPIKLIPELTKGTFVPRGSTPLIDAAYNTIKAVEESKPEGKVVICIQTDGEENSSREHTWDELNDLIKEKTALGWQFNFMGASIDAYKASARMGLSSAATVSYDSRNLRATKAAFGAMASNTKAYASGRARSTVLSAEQKMASGDTFDPEKKEVKKPIVDKITL